MDVAGAKTLNERLDSSSANEAPGSSADVPEDALPLYRWLGISPPEADKESEARSV